MSNSVIRSTKGQIPRFLGDFEKYREGRKNSLRHVGQYVPRHQG